jgi:hypothetical protein
MQYLDEIGLFGLFGLFAKHLITLSTVLSSCRTFYLSSYFFTIEFRHLAVSQIKKEPIKFRNTLLSS